MAALEKATAMDVFVGKNRKAPGFALDDETERGASHVNYLGRGVLDILDALPFYVLLIDKNHRILLANKATRDHLGMEADEIIGDYCPRVVHGLEHGAFPGCPLEEAVVKNQAVEREHYDEDIGRWFKTAVYPTGASSLDGQGIYFHMVQDITEQKEALSSPRADVDQV